MQIDEHQELRFSKIEDRAHGWLAVPVWFVQELGITVSRCSHISPDEKTAYLEEDADLNAFCAAFNAKFGRQPLWNTDYQANTFVRNLNSYPQSLNPQETTMTTEATTRQILNGHTSQETAYLVNDHPYGPGLRCRIRYWLETAIGGEKKGATRFMEQTTDPEAIEESWDKPWASIYQRGLVLMYLDEKSHVQWITLNDHSDTEQLEAAKAWQGLSDEQRAEIDHTIEAKAVSAAMCPPCAEA